MTFLEKLLESTNYGPSLLILVFHLSHLLLRLLITPSDSSNFLIFTRLYSY
jgi:hypothetical protein